MVSTPTRPAGRREAIYGRSARPRLIICDDHRMIVEMLAANLAPAYEVVGVALDGDELLSVIERCPADCLLLDLFLPKHNGIELIPRVRAIQPLIRILAVTMVLDRATAAAAFAAGASGFVPKDAGVEELRHAISEVLAGRRYLSPRVPKNTHRVGLHALYPALCNLTPRQEQIVVMLGRGLSESAIAHALSVTPAAITLHKRNLMRVLGLDSGTCLREFAFRVRGAIAAARRGDSRWRAPANSPPRRGPSGRSRDEAEPPGP